MKNQLIKVYLFWLSIILFVINMVVVDTRSPAAGDGVTKKQQVLPWITAVYALPLAVFLMF